MLLFKSYDEPVVALEGGALSQAAIEAFVEGGAEPSLPEMDEAPRNKKAVSRIFGDQDTPKLLAVVGEVRPWAGDMLGCGDWMTCSTPSCVLYIWVGPVILCTPVNKGLEWWCSGLPLHEAATYRWRACSALRFSMHKRSSHPLFIASVLIASMPSMP